MTTFGLRLVLDARQLKQGVLVAKGQLTGLKTAANTANAALTRTQKGMNLTGGVASRLREQMITLTTAFIGLRAISNVVNILKDFDQEMQTVRGVTGATIAEFKALTDTARELGATTRFTATQAAEGLTLLSRAGFSAVEAMDAVGASLNLAVGGAVSMARATEVVATAIRAFGLDATQAVRVTDAFITVTNNANTTINALGESMKFVGPVAGALGVSVEEAAAAVGTLGDAGIQGSLAGTQLRGVFAGLSSVTERARTALDSMGLSLEDINPAGQSLLDVFEKLNRAGLNAERAFAIFGRRQATGALILSRNIDKFRQLTEEANSNAGATQRMADVMDDSLNGALLQLKSAVEELVLSMGDSGLGATLRGTAEFATFVARALAGIETEAGELEPVVQAVAVAVSALSSAFLAFAGLKIAGLLLRATKAMFSLGAATRSVRGAFSLFTVTSFAAAAAVIQYSNGLFRATKESRALARATEEVNRAAASGDPFRERAALQDEVKALQDAIDASLDLQASDALAALGEGIKDVFTEGTIDAFNREIDENRKKITLLNDEIRRQEKVSRDAETALVDQIIAMDRAGVAIESIISQFGRTRVENLLGAEAVQEANARFQKLLRDTFTVDPQTADARFFDAEFGPIRDSIFGAIATIQEDLALSGQEPAGLRRIREQVARDVKGISAALETESTRIAQSIAAITADIRRIEAEGPSERDTRGVISLKIDREELQGQLRDIQGLAQGLEELSGKQLLFQAQQRAANQAVMSATASFREQAAEVALDAEALEDYNLEQRIFKELQDVGAQNTDLFTDALARSRAELEQLRNLKQEEKERAATVAVMQQTAALQEQINTIGLSGDALERYNELQKARLELERAGILDTAEGTRQLDELKNKFNELAAIRQLKGIFDEVGRGLADAFTDVITGAKSAGEAIEDFLKQVSRAIVQKAVTSLITGAIGGAFGGGTFAKGGVFNNGQVTPFARGGIISSPTVFPLANGIGLAGEAGPEAIVPLRRGPGGALGIEASGGVGGGTTVFNFNISTPDANSFRKSQKQMIRDAQRSMGRPRGGAGV